MFDSNPTGASETDDRDHSAHNGEGNAMGPGEGIGKRVFIETYGCQMNLADSELMGGILAGRGFTAAAEREDADVILINTCAVRERAEERVFGRLSHLLKYKHANPDLVLGVTGCMAKHLESSIVDRAPYVDLVIGPDAYRRLPELLDAAQVKNAGPQIDVKLDNEERYEGYAPVRKEGIGAWVSIQRGCDKFCTFCVVPFTRGRERGLPPDAVVRQCEAIAAEGYKEVTLLGQTVNSYQHEGVDFAALLELVCAVDGIERIRFTSPYPTDFNERLLTVMAREPKVSPYVHLPVQSGSDDVLARMKRQYTRAEFEALVVNIREAVPGVAISTDVIVGFPGESEEDFEATVDLLEKTHFDFAYLFRYSERSGTNAARKLEDDVADADKARRLKTIIALQEKISREVFAKKIGSTERVLIVGPSRRDENRLCGRTEDFKMAIFPRVDGMEAGELVDVLITDATSHTLMGESVAPKAHQGNAGAK